MENVVLLAKTGVGGRGGGNNGHVVSLSGVKQGPEQMLPHHM